MLFVLLFLSALLNLTPTRTRASATSSKIPGTKFDFGTFYRTSCSYGGRLICMGSATSKDGYLALTPDPQDDPKAQYKVGRVLYKIPVRTWPANFNTTFTVNMAPFPHSNNSGDGITFIMAPDISPPPLNSFGGFLGIMNTTAEGVFKGQLAVEFDTFKNSFTNDINDNHVGIDTTSITNPIAAIYLPIKLTSGRDIEVGIQYNFKKRKLVVFMKHVEERFFLRVLKQDLNLSETVPDFVYVGFTASTGFYSGSQRIKNWSFCSYPPCPIGKLCSYPPWEIYCLDDARDIGNVAYEK